MTRHWFDTDEEFQRYVAQLYEEWRARPSEDACEDFDEWKVAEIRRLRDVIAAMRVNAAGLREALWNLRDACLLADRAEELSEHIDGSLIDKATEILRLTA